MKKLFHDSHIVIDRSYMSQVFINRDRKSYKYLLVAVILELKVMNKLNIAVTASVAIANVRLNGHT